MSIKCVTCGKEHDGLPDIGAGKPDHWWYIPEAERAERVKLTSDTCVIDDEDYFIRGVIEIPVHEQAEPFGFGVWVSQKRENYLEYLKHFDSDEIGPFFGWLCTRLACYSENTLLLKTMAHFRCGNLRPLIELEPKDYPLAIDQRNGISLARAWELVHHYIPADGV